MQPSRATDLRIGEHVTCINIVGGTGERATVGDAFSRVAAPDPIRRNYGLVVKVGHSDVERCLVGGGTAVSDTDHERVRPYVSISWRAGKRAVAGNGQPSRTTDFR